MLRNIASSVFDFYDREIWIALYINTKFEDSNIMYCVYSEKNKRLHNK